MPAVAVSPPIARHSPLVSAAERLARRVETLVDEVARLRADNATLRWEVSQAVALMDSAAVAGSRRGRGMTESMTVGRHRGRRHAKSTKERATPKEVTSAVVRAVLVKLGESTASEIAAEITLAGAPVGGRAVRFLAESAGATVMVGADGRRRYRLG